MAALPIVEHLDILKNGLGGFVPCGVVPMVHLLTLERPKETFGTRVVPTVASAARAGGETMHGEHLLVPRSGKLAAAIGMMHQSGPGRPVRQRHEERLLGQFPDQSLAHRPADHEA